MEIIKSIRIGFARILYRLGGADYDVIKDCSKGTRFRYLCLAMALLLATTLAFIGGFDIAHQFTSVVLINISVASLWALMTFSYDFFIVNGAHGGGALKKVRILVGFANIIITIVALFILMNQAQINSQITLNNSVAVKDLDDAYLGAKETRYATVIKKQAEAEKYNSEVILPEARRGYPGPKYIEKKAAYDVMITSINADKEKLDTEEEQYRLAYQSKRDALTSVTSNDFFSKARMLPQVLGDGGWASILLAVCLFIFLSYVDLQAISIKLAMSANDEYPTAEKEHESRMTSVRRVGAEKDVEIKKSRILLDRGRQEHDVDEEKHTDFIRKIDDQIVREAEIRGRIVLLRRKGYHAAARALEIELERLIRAAGAKDPEKEDSENDQPTGTVGVEEILRLTEPMRETLETIRSSAEPDKLVESIFHWILENIQYDQHHGKFFYRTARETYNDGHGVCGELAVCYIALLREVGISAHFVEVTVDCKGDKVDHACVLVKEGEEEFLSDPAYRMFRIDHPQYAVWNDEKMVAEYAIWNK